MSHQTKCICPEICAIKGYEGIVLANFLAQHSCMEVQNPLAECQGYLQIKPWTLAFEGLKHQKGVGVGVVITSLEEVDKKFVYRLNVQYSNNQA